MLLVNFFLSCSGRQFRECITNCGR